MYLAIAITLAIAICSIVDRICTCLETKYIAESEKEDGNTEDNQKER